MTRLMLRRWRRRHIGGYYLVHFDGLNHVCRNEVELYVARIAFGRGNAVAVDGDGAEVSTRAPHLPEACLALVVLHVDAGDAFKGVTDVGVGELATWSAETTFVIPMLFFCELMARRCPWKAPPTTTSCNSTPSFSTTSFPVYGLRDGDFQFYGRVAHVASPYWYVVPGQGREV